ncbi:hypothetical protein Kpol_1010p34 [Vanderwaltozyma polyspora DSM 70294]|uniref:Xylulose kinase n=1 Tax=Vanderwaltozyma polyspora (strain ATCC 22028 / DSM 70294 / BCRC 21397 / CBS 2163 / NBRC 10782 / NRRL Y-8283 / UCD 57-17) TaxID=436907 RepID=A7TII0_VANPO|nr:uncharacterized protein Kpol_1010p34 [Vanderwaltozyma polyspora DSM 70294]EDO17918.1 hypothetical protein Kpol_1010p34 [Vanderwaltozyma polyspora DSM 70294]
MVEDKYYLGFDLSTQQLKCLAIDQNLNIIHAETVQFDKELPKYNTHNGVYINGNVVDCPVGLWVDAIDLIFQKFHESGFDLKKVEAMSGSCQQHGSVFWSHESESLLNSLDVSKGSLSQQLVPLAFSRQNAPNWQDHSTSLQCNELEASVDGMEELCEITGSRAHYRFTGPQILKIAEAEPDNYSNTRTISLVSSFVHSILCGKLLPLEEADACGMNLYDIKNHNFDQRLLNVIDSKINQKNCTDLYSKLMGNPLQINKNPISLGNISKYFVQKYDINPNCSIFSFTGDNLATICSLPLKENDVLVSLGTSTTVLLVTSKYHPSPNYHLFIHPTIPNHFMGMICYSNGSLAREKIRDAINDNDTGDWEAFNKEVCTEGNSNADEIGVYFPISEIVPNVEAVCKRAKFNIKTGDIEKYVDSFKNDPKNIVESQALSCRVRLTPLLSDGENVVNDSSNEKVKFDFENLSLLEYKKVRPSRVFFVGGASKNDAIVDKYAEVLGAKEGNYRFSNTSNSCALGGCYKAIWSKTQEMGQIPIPFVDFLNEKFNWDNIEKLPITSKKDWENFYYKIKPLSQLECSLMKE